MQDRYVNRRRLIAALAMSSSTLALGTSGLNLKTLLQSSDGESKVRKILKKHFSLAAGAEQAIGEFYQSLLLAKDHRENQQFFLDHLDKKELEERLEIYVIEEFFVSTYYISLLGGQDTELKMLPS